ncbi:MAG TPA: TraR/DksA C4-type zinc finger protein [Actinomycetes bacterium]|nr:TraR/DksA C4-type zinc finger protein [Actinomycetes bacterium]
MSDVRAVLTVKREELEAELAALSAPAVDTGGISFGKRVGDGTSIAVERITQVAAHDGLQEVLADVNKALAALDDGTYGTCEVCGEPIAEGRLEIRPWSTRCINCA